MIDYKEILYYVTGGIVICFGWILRTIYKEINTIKEDMNAIRVHIADEYIKESKFSDLISAFFRKLDRIEEKLDRKVDKS